MNGRKPPRLALSADEAGLDGRWEVPSGSAGRVFLLFSGVKGLKPPRFVFCPVMFCRVTDGAPGLRVGDELNPPRVAAVLAAFRDAGLFTSRDAGVPGLGFSIVPLAATALLEFALTRPAACTGVMWFRCMACCNWAVCRSNDVGRDAARPLPKKRCAVPCTVPGAGARPLADKLARDGTTGRLPVIMRALCN